MSICFPVGKWVELLRGWQKSVARRLIGWFTLRMPPPPLHVRTEAEKNEVLLAQHEMIERMAARISELGLLVGKPRKTSKNSYIPPSKDDFGKRGCKGRKPKAGKRPPREGKHRPLAETPYASGEDRGY